MTVGSGYKPRHFKVILVRGQSMDSDRVSEALIQVLEFPPHQVLETVQKMHASGQAVLFSSHKEYAEVYARKLRGYDLHVRLEPAE